MHRRCNNKKETLEYSQAWLNDNIKDTGQKPI